MPDAERKAPIRRSKRSTRPRNPGASRHSHRRRCRIPDRPRDRGPAPRRPGKPARATADRHTRTTRSHAPGFKPPPKAGRAGESRRLRLPCRGVVSVWGLCVRPPDHGLPSSRNPCSRDRGPAGCKAGAANAQIRELRAVIALTGCSLPTAKFANRGTLVVEKKCPRHPPPWNWKWTGAAGQTCRGFGGPYIGTRRIRIRIRPSRSKGAQPDPVVPAGNGWRGLAQSQLRTSSFDGLSRSGLATDVLPDGDGSQSDSKWALHVQAGPTDSSIARMRVQGAAVNRADARAKLARLTVRAAAKIRAIWQEFLDSAGHKENRGRSDCARRAASADWHQGDAIQSGQPHDRAGPGPRPQPGSLPPPEQYRAYEQAAAGTAKWLRHHADREQRNCYRLHKRRQTRAFRLQALALLVEAAIRIAPVAAPIVVAGLAVAALYLLGPVIGPVSAVIQIGVTGFWWRRCLRRRGHSDHRATGPGKG